MNDEFTDRPLFGDELQSDDYRDWNDDLDEEMNDLDNEYAWDAPEEVEGPGFEYESDDYENEWNLFVDSWQTEDPYFEDNEIGVRDEFILNHDLNE